MIDLRTLVAPIPATIFLASVAVGAVTALASLEVSGLWQDELYTGWIVDPQIGFPATVQRALHDVGPPLYYLILWPFTWLLGPDEVGLRLLSALCAIGAVGLVVLGTRRSFSLQGRLFAAAMATGSLYWTLQAQNGRSYALGMLISAAILVLALRALEDRDRRGDLPWMFVLMMVGTFTHFYLLFEALAVLGVLFLYRRRNRMLLTVVAAALLALAVLYLELVVRQRSYAALDTNWISSNRAWYVEQFEGIVGSSLPRAGMFAIAGCMVVALAISVQRSRPGPAWLWVLCLGVPIGVAVQAVAASVLSSPNFHQRYVLISSPFLWGLWALMYDRSIGRLASPWRAVAGLVAAALVAWMAVAMARARFRPSGEAFRSSAAAIASHPGCRGAIIPAVLVEKRQWFRSLDGIEPIRAAYAKYLRGYAEPHAIFSEDIQAGRLDGLHDTFVARIDGDDCPVLLWAVHGIDRAKAQQLAHSVLTSTGRGDQAGRLKFNSFPGGPYGFVVTIEKPGP